MSYRNDPDLDFLRGCSSSDLHPLVDFLTQGKDGRVRLTETLTSSPRFRAFAPAHEMYWDRIAAELQKFGANSIATLFRNGEGVLYRELLLDVCDKLDVNYNKQAPTAIIEGDLLMKLLTDSIDRMDEEAEKELIEAIGQQTVSLTGQAVTGALQVATWARGAAAYRVPVVVANAVTHAVVGHGLSVGARSALMRAVGIAAGPLGWVTTGLWTLGALAGPAYRVIVPCVVYVAILRAKQRAATLTSA